MKIAEQLTYFQILYNVQSRATVCIETVNDSHVETVIEKSECNWHMKTFYNVWNKIKKNRRNFWYLSRIAQKDTLTFIQ